jgi:hypothetical protein
MHYIVCTTRDAYNAQVDRSPLKSLGLSLQNRPGDQKQTLQAIACSLRENKGLVDLDIRFVSSVSDGAWDAVCNSLNTHPTLQVFSLREKVAFATMLPSVLKSRIEVLLDMIKVNTSIRRISLDYRFASLELYPGTIMPYLVTNQL